ncbi:MAG: DUF992 domain-containing protein, partial [Fimbriimonadaceae bacterium]|nr:DUF992 domain-containing protein [Alphaproteobacteria bacterium]
SAGDLVEIGMLKCEIDGGVGMIITSTRDLQCRFEPSDRSAAEDYSGTFSRIGLDIGKTDSSRLVWAVFAPAYSDAAGKLTGSYGGVSAEATLGYGLGANVLVGGFEKSIMLQPVSVTAQQGVDIAVGLASLNLDLL